MTAFRSDNPDAVFDGEGREFVVGGAVVCDGQRGVVTAVTSWDGDSDGEGGAVAIHPVVKVAFEDGMDDEFTAHHRDFGKRSAYPNPGPTVCLDLSVAGHLETVQGVDEQAI